MIIGNDGFLDDFATRKKDSACFLSAFAAEARRQSNAMEFSKSLNVRLLFLEQGRSISFPRGFN